MQKRYIKVSLAAVIGAVMLIVLLATASTLNVRAADTEKGIADTVTVSGSYTIYITPDKAELHMAVTTQDAAADKAQEKNTKDVDAVIKKLKELGVKEKSIVTSGYNIYQEYDYENDKPAGYNVTTSLTVKDVEIDKAGTILSECVAAGVNEVQYISYSCSNYDEEYENALTGAVAAAKKKAEVLAKAADRTLDGVQTIIEGYQDTSARYVTKNIATEEAASIDSAAGVTLMPGDSEIIANVTVTYYLK